MERPALSCERAPGGCQSALYSISRLKSAHEPQDGIDTEKDWPTDRPTDRPTVSSKNTLTLVSKGLTISFLRLGLRSVTLLVTQLNQEYKTYWNLKHAHFPKKAFEILHTAQALMVISCLSKSWRGRLKFPVHIIKYVTSLAQTLLSRPVSWSWC